MSLPNNRLGVLQSLQLHLKRCVLTDEAANANLQVFGLTRLKIYVTILVPMKLFYDNDSSFWNDVNFLLLLLSTCTMYMYLIHFIRCASS